MEWIEHSINGVPGALAREREGQRLIKQVWRSKTRLTPRGSFLRVEVRHDDSCGNGRPSFAVTATEKGNGIDAAGCFHGEVAETFPELEPLLKWHLCFTDGPMHYLANTMFLAGDRDCWGMKKGEVKLSERQALHGKDIHSQYDWQEKYRQDGWLPLSMISHNEYDPSFPVKLMPLVQRRGEGKERELDSARKAAIWPEATDDVLCSPPEVLKYALEARLPELLKEFREVVESTGLAWE